MDMTKVKNRRKTSIVIHALLLVLMRFFHKCSWRVQKFVPRLTKSTKKSCPTDILLTIYGPSNDLRILLPKNIVQRRKVNWPKLLNSPTTQLIKFHSVWLKQDKGKFFLTFKYFIRRLIAALQSWLKVRSTWDNENLYATYLKLTAWKFHGLLDEHDDEGNIKKRNIKIDGKMLAELETEERDIVVIYILNALVVRTCAWFLSCNPQQNLCQLWRRC